SALLATQIYQTITFGVCLSLANVAELSKQKSRGFSNNTPSLQSNNLHCRTPPIRGKISPMDRADVAFWLGIVATGTSFTLALLRGYEFYRERRISFDAD